MITIEECEYSDLIIPIGCQIKVISVCYPTQHEKNFSQEENSF
jgi:hypothetical protein